jgi:excisionase family DNA binding protein
MRPDGAPFNSAATNAATGEEEKQGHRFLTVHEVAALLQVPVSWVYAHMRKRSRDRLPGYRLGKYWRFSEDELLAWVRRRRGVEHVA